MVGNVNLTATVNVNSDMGKYLRKLILIKLIKKGRTGKEIKLLKMEITK